MVIEVISVVTLGIGGIHGIMNAKSKSATGSSVEKVDLKLVEDAQPYENPPTPAELKALDRWFSDRNL